MLQNDAFTQRVMSDLEPDLLNLLQTRVNTFLKWDLVRFFGDNPGTLDSADQLARYIGRDPDAVVAELDALAQQGILTRDERAAPHLYALSDDGVIRALVQKFLRAVQDRDFRVKAMYHVMRGMQGH